MLQKVATLLTVLGLSLPALAGGFDFLPMNTGPEKEFHDLMNSGNFKQALIAWPTAHQASTFGESANGVAVLSYLLLQNGMPYFALDMLASRTNPRALHPALLAAWEKEIKNSGLIQKGYISTTGGWRNLVDNEDAKLTFKNKRDISLAFSKAARAGGQINRQARILWQIATRAPQIEDTSSALKALKMLGESKQTVIGLDQIASATGRVLYQRGDMDGALKAYQQIPKSSSLWIESVEERAWAYLRHDDFDKAMGETVTLLSPALAPLVGPESYFLANLLALKVCDYSRIFKNSETFKKRHRDRIVELQNLATTGTNKNFNAVMASFEQKGVSPEAAGPLVDSIPRAALRDQKLTMYLESRREILAEITRSSQVNDFAQTLGENTSLAKTIHASKAKADVFRQLAARRMRLLAGEELKEYRNILNKMHIVEAEVIERLHVDESLKGERSKLARNDDKGDVLVFPYNSNEVWVDELDNYKAQVKDCPTLKGAGL